jgi:hypothetical protein
MEERSAESDLMDERFNRLLDNGRIIVEHGLKMRSNDLQHQYIVLPVRALDSEMIQESDDVFGPWMSPGLRRKMTVYLDLAVPPGKFCHCEL